MLGNATLELDLSVAGDGSNSVLLHNVNSGEPYSSEYRAKSTDREHILIVRHTKEKNRVKGSEVDRHNVVYTQNIYPTVLFPQGQTIQVYSVIRNAPELPVAELQVATAAAMHLTNAVSSELAIWKN